MQVDEGTVKARKRIIISMVVIALLALGFLGVAAYILIQAKSGAPFDDRTVKLTQIFALAGVFMLVLVFGSLIPRLFSKDKFANENEMRERLAKYLKADEKLEAGVYALVEESYVNATYKKCRYENRRLIRDENATEIFSLGKKKVCEYKVYLGISKDSFLVVECEENKHFYESPAKFTFPFDIPELPEDIDDREVGTRFGLDEIKTVKVENEKFNTIMCTVTMKNSTFFKIKIADNAGPKSNMPNHMENREKILNVLKERG